MKSLEYLSHTADVRMKIKGSSREELFLVGLEGIGRILKEEVFNKTSDPVEIVEIQINSVDITALLVEFLNEVLLWSHTLKAVFFDVDIQELKEDFIQAKIKGVFVEEFDEDIKAVTYHEAEVVKNPDGYWETVIVLDI
jgi:SHS2 domain-containing protein